MNETSALLYLALFRGGDDETDKSGSSDSFPNRSVVVVMLARFNALQSPDPIGLTGFLVLVEKSEDGLFPLVPIMICFRL